jgi:signal transduction histidine kinase/HAMP domain-containing protein
VIFGTVIAKGKVMNLSLRHKFYLGFGGLLAIIILVTSIGSRVIDSYSQALQTTLRENYASIGYGENMKDALRRMEGGVQLGLSGNLAAARDTIFRAISAFEDNLRKEQANITVIGEQETVTQLAALWNAYGREIGAAIDTSLSRDVRSDLFWKTLIPLGDRIQGAAQKICEINLDNMSSVDGSARAKADEAAFVIYLLVFAGASLAVALLIVTGRAILQPLKTLTDSVQEIKKGNLNIVLQPRSRDEVGLLTESFNEMAAQLREYRRAEMAKLIRTEHSTQSVIDSLPDAIAILNAHGIVELSNHAARSLFGLHPDVNIGTRKDDLLRQLFFSALLRDERGGQLSPGSALQVFDNGHERFFQPRAIPILDETDITIGVALVLADVTRQKRVVELEVEPISVVSHELKTPLTSVRMAIHMLLDERIGSLSPKQLDLLGAARDDCDRLYQIVENLLDISRMEAGRAVLEMKPTSPLSLVTQALETFATGFRGAGVELSSKISDDLPDVLADNARIQHVFSNLLSNALKFSLSGHQVVVRAEASDNEVTFTVQDQGMGIPPELLPRVFDKFFRFHVTGRAEGAGLGLAIAKDVVEAHGGRIWAESVIGQGSQFHFTLRAATISPITS